MKGRIQQLRGPILILGAGGFVGFNMLLALLRERGDVYGVIRNPDNNWRVQLSKVPKAHMLTYDIRKKRNINTVVKAIQPKTVFNFAAYGAYSRQKRIDPIFETNLLSSIHIIEALKKSDFHAYIYAGSQSEYGLNASGPKETGELNPNSHYAVSKTGAYYAHQYYGKIEKLPILHLRLYSAYGPWEEPDRLIPILLSNARKGEFPALVHENISRDFIFVNDIVSAFIHLAGELKPELYGEAFNIASGTKTTMRDLAFLVKDIWHISENPIFNTMDKREWDLTDWYGNSEKIKKIFGWKPKISLEEGLKKTVTWQSEIGYEKALAKWIPKR